MSAAEVTFQTLDYKPAEPGKEVRFGFKCPKRPGGRCEGLMIAGRTNIKRGPREQGGTPQWDWNGDRTAPTFAPSINCLDCWHGYIEKGRCLTTAKAEEPELPP
jgi:hypothetical protein